MSGALGPILILGGALAFTGTVLYLHNRLWYKGREAEEPAEDAEARPAAAPRPDGCCSMHEVCEKAVEAVADNNLYYDDEELDEFRGRDADSYTEAEVDRFREVLLTLRRDELLAWEAALRERQLALPAQLRDELILLLA